MKVINTTQNKNSFKSGLNTKIRIKEKFINPKYCEKELLKQYNIETNFLNNKSAAFANLLSLNILKEFLAKNNISFCLPPAIIIYKKNNLIENSCANNFCIPDTKKVLKNDYPFAGRSIFFSDFYNLLQIDEETETLFKNSKNSSNHFLAPFIHEWIHSLHLDYIYNKLGYGGNCEYLQEIYPNKNNNITGVKYLKELETKTLSKRENEIVYNILGEYSTLGQNQYLEIFAETCTKLICDSLNGINLEKNPFDLIKKLPLEFRNIFNKISIIK